jgi:hypothetical protein
MDGDDARGDAVGPQVDRVDAVAGPHPAHRRYRCRRPVLVGGNGDAQHRWTFLPKGPEHQVSQISFAFWFVKPVRLKSLVERSTISREASSTLGAAVAGTGLVLMGRCR